MQGELPRARVPEDTAYGRAEYGAPDAVGVPESSMCLHPERMSRFSGLCKTDNHCLARGQAEIPP